MGSECVWSGEQTEHRSKHSLPYRVNLACHEAPDHVLFPYILSGYRAGGTYWQCLCALFAWHTETMNAWTMIFCGATSCLLLHRVVVREDVSIGQAFPFACITFAVVLHMPFSVGFHLFRGMNPTVYNLWRRLDQAFIFIACVPLCLGLCYCVFSAWATLVNVLVTTVVAIVGCREVWRLKPDFRRRKSSMVLFVGSGVLCSWFPMLYVGARDLAMQRLSLSAAAAAGVIISLGFGSYAYASSVPEKFAPGKFDFFFSSHQIMHWTVLIARICEYAFVLENFRAQRLALSTARGL